MENVQQYISPELLIIVPVLFLIGTQLKRIPKFPNSKIPLTLGGIAVALSILYTFSTVPLNSVQEVLKALFIALTQGLLCAGSSVYTHQLIKQGIQGGSPAEFLQPPVNGSAPPQSRQDTQR
ncbi:MAG: phage holin family protein [Ruthenibacterium sp.]